MIVRTGVEIIMHFSNMTMIATAAFGLEGVVGAELKRLGIIHKSSA